ncbi:MAG TPA: isoprenylcysteine carboxylmethyltransferase family protein [Acidobacteriaceae bacterium]|jgi:protein-S-isoprenylcysteine O-methyltransferase Ste14|nr:isoprenylcysteine carboxylmethyltransferase family protein [Acidobacteriaceae bacterium]
MHTEFLFDVLTKVWLPGEILIVVLTQTRRGQGRIQDRGTQIILWLVIVASLWIDERLHSWLPPDMPGSHTWLRPTALGILALGLAIRAIAIATLGRAFSTNVATQPGHTLQRRGLYSLVRHPSYLGLELILLAFALHARTWACFAVVLIPTTLALLYRIHVEETALRLAFGGDYEAYSRTTKRLIPGIY